jgi:ribosomal protein S18 acetylase RimI-like enzyme
MFSSLQITPATDKDIPSLHQLVNSAYRGESSKKGWTTEADLLDGIRTDEDGLKEMMDQPNAVILKCEDESNGIIGCVYLQQQKDELYLGMLTVSPELQAKGIGKQLLNAADNYALQLNCTAIIMTVISVRKELIAWYERHGFHTTGETKPFPNNVRFGIPKQSLEFVIMRKQMKDKFKSEIRE